MEVDRVRFRCRKLGHMAQDCRSHLDLRVMNYEQIMAYPKDKMAKEVKKDFPDESK